MKDLRDPRCVGHKLLVILEDARLSYPQQQWTASRVADANGLACPIYSSTLMSNDPAEHHSKTPQHVGTEFGAPSSQEFSG